MPVQAEAKFKQIQANIKTASELHPLQAPGSHCKQKYKLKRNTSTYKLPLVNANKYKHEAERLLGRAVHYFFLASLEMGPIGVLKKNSGVHYFLLALAISF